MIAFPHTYEVMTEWKGEKEGVVSSQGRPNLHVFPPPQFDGPENHWSPEHLLLAAADSCLLATFLSLSKRKDFRAISYESLTTGTLEKTPDGLLFTRLDHTVDLCVNPGEEEQGRKLAEAAHKYCLISNSLKAESSLRVKICVQGS